MSPSDAKRIEEKVDALIEDVRSILVIEERQKQDWRRMEAIERRLEAVEGLAKATDKNLERWINRGVGAWALAATIAAGLKYWPVSATLPPEAPRIYAPAIAAPIH